MFEDITDSAQELLNKLGKVGSEEFKLQARIKQLEAKLEILEGKLKYFEIVDIEKTIDKITKVMLIFIAVVALFIVGIMLNS